jgi:hypothetical protein
MNLLEILHGQLDDNVINDLSQHIGAEPTQTAQGAKDIFATLLGGLTNNIQKPGGLEMLGSVLDRDHDGSMLDDLMGLVTGAKQQESQTAAPAALNGLGMLKHILGGQQETAAQQISQNSGLNMGQIMKLMPILAPIVMSVLGKSKSQGNLGLGDLAGILMGGAQQAQQQSGGLGDLLSGVLGGVFGGQQTQQQQQHPESQGADILGSLLKGVFGK